MQLQHGVHLSLSLIGFLFEASKLSVSWLEEVLSDKWERRTGRVLV